MQFSIAVLPAPFGPTIASSSDGAASNETDLIAAIPPKLSSTSLTTSLAPRSLIPTISACACIAAGRDSCAFPIAEIELLHVLVIQSLMRLP